VRNPSLFQSAGTASFTDKDYLDALQLYRSANIGPITYYNLTAFYGSPANALHELPEIAKRSGSRKPYKICPRGVVEKELNDALKTGAKPVAHFDTLYPQAMREIDDCPPVFYALGNIALLARPGIGIVGARNASLNGRKLTQRLATELGQQGQIIVSGMARGIDTAAHQGALTTGTIAVLAGGVDVVYPPENQGLYEAIRDTSGLLVAEQPCGTQPQARHFPRRNRIISALSWGTVVIEASIKSGSLITARYALDQGREVMAVPGSPMDTRAGGPNKLIQDGAKLVTSSADILAEYNPDNPLKGLGESPQQALTAPMPKADISSADLDKARETIKNLLSPEPTEINDIARESSLTIGTVLTILLEFEITGVVTRHSGNRVSRIESED